jgi:thymidylate synthase
MSIDLDYANLVDDIISYGEDRSGRTAESFRSIFGSRMEFNLREGFPILTTKNVHFKSVVVELLWFLRGDSNIKYLKDHGVSIWDEWANAEGELGPVYGKQWRSWPSPSGPIDQISRLIEDLRKSPQSRRHLVVAWNPAEINSMALPPCHCLFQFFLGEKGLSCQLYQRSVDVGLGLPFNISSYALLTHLIAKELNVDVDRFIHVGGDVHLYHNHIEGVGNQVLRSSYDLPRLWLNPDVTGIFNYTPEDIKLINYQSHAKIKLPIAK